MAIETTEQIRELCIAAGIDPRHLHQWTAADVEAPPPLDAAPRQFDTLMIGFDISRRVGGQIVACLEFDPNSKTEEIVRRIHRALSEEDREILALQPERRAEMDELSRFASLHQAVEHIRMNYRDLAGLVAMPASKTGDRIKIFKCDANGHAVGEPLALVIHRY